VTTQSQSVSSRETIVVGPPRGGSLGRRLIDTFLEWHRRINSRRELALLSELELRDIGYPDRLEAEKAKPFWRA
jgi:uncharacterized protein YjiS (DUF1127 family)